MLHLHENGIFVVPEAPPEITATKWAGDSWHAFQVFQAWLLATREHIPWDQAFKVNKQKTPTPNDVFMMIAIANALGKSERWLNASETVWEQTKKAAKKPRIKPNGPFKDAVIVAMLEGKNNHQVFKLFMQTWQLGHINGLTIETVDDNSRYVTTDDNSRYVITDENNELGKKNYKWLTLRKWYSEME